MLIPRQKVPELKVETLDAGTFDIGAERPENGTLILFYRGLHCPLCIKYLKEIGAALPELAQRGISHLALSSDGHERTKIMAETVGFKDLRFGYDLSLQKARDWGLFISTSRGPSTKQYPEPELFSEPGLFWVKSDQTLFFSAVQTMPFTRPDIAQILRGIDLSIENDYPARGHYIGSV